MKQIQANSTSYGGCDGINFDIEFVVSESNDYSISSNVKVIKGISFDFWVQGINIAWTLIHWFCNFRRWYPISDIIVARPGFKPKIPCSASKKLNLYTTAVKICVCPIPIYLRQEYSVLNKMCLWNMDAPGYNKVRIWQNLLILHFDPVPSPGTMMWCQLSVSNY